MPYNLGKYRLADNGKIYRVRWWWFNKLIDSGTYSWREGVRKVNELCGIFE